MAVLGSLRAAAPTSPSRAHTVGEATVPGLAALGLPHRHGRGRGTAWPKAAGGARVLQDSSPGLLPAQHRLALQEARGGGSFPSCPTAGHPSRAWRSPCCRAAERPPLCRGPEPGPCRVPPSWPVGFPALTGPESQASLRKTPAVPHRRPPAHHSPHTSLCLPCPLPSWDPLTCGA